MILEGQVTDVAKKRIQVKKHGRMQPQECYRWHKESADKTAMHLFFWRPGEGRIEELSEEGIRENCICTTREKAGGAGFL